MAPKRKRSGLVASSRKRTSRPSWSQLPIDVLDNIIKMLELPVDAVSFSGVCKPWRNIALGMHTSLHCKLPMHHFLPKSSPLPMLLHPGFEGPDAHQLYSLDERKIYGGFRLQELSNKWIVGSGAGWLVTVDTADPAITLVNPLTRKKIPLPHLSTVPLCPSEHDDNDPTAYWYIRKVIVCSYRGSLLAVALVSACKAIRFCRVGDSKWTKLENSPTFIDDIIIHSGKLYAVNKHTALFEIDITSLATVTMVAMLPIACRPWGKCFLVDLCGELVLISRIMGMPKIKCSRALKRRASVLTSAFEVYKLVEDEYAHFEGYMSETGMRYPEKVGHSWVRLDNLGHHMVFIGYNHSLLLDSRVYPRCKGSCIYFADYRHDAYDHLKMRGICNHTRHDVGVYDMGDQSVKHFEDFCCASSPMNMVWLCPNLSTEPEMQLMPR